jgi:hypothetical protein
MPESNLMSVHEPKVVEAVEPDKIARFADFINAGVNSWINAGKLLVEMKEADPNIFEKITAKHPGISWDILRAFENIGLKRVYPYLMLDGCAGSKKLLTFPYEKQVQLYQARLDVVTGLKDGKPVVEQKRLQELNSFEVDRIFMGERVKTVQEQAMDWENRTRSYTAPKPKPIVKSRCLDELASRAEDAPEPPRPYAKLSVIGTFKICFKDNHIKLVECAGRPVNSFVLKKSGEEFVSEPIEVKYVV